MKKLLLLPMVAMLWLASFNTATAQCPDFKFCIEQPNSNVPFFNVNLIFSGTLSNITDFRATVQIKGDFFDPGLISNVAISNVHPMLSNLDQSITSYNSDTKYIIKLKGENISPAITLSGGTITAFSFSYEGEVDECYHQSMLYGQMKFNGSSEACNAICAESTHDSGTFYCFDAPVIPCSEDFTFCISNSGTDSHGLSIFSVTLTSPDQLITGVEFINVRVDIEDASGNPIDINIIQTNMQSSDFASTNLIPIPVYTSSGKSIIRFSGPVSQLTLTGGSFLVYSFVLAGGEGECFNTTLTKGLMLFDANNNPSCDQVCVNNTLLYCIPTLSYKGDKTESLIKSNDGSISNITMDETKETLVVQDAMENKSFVAPNPFKETAEIHFYTPTATPATISIFDNTGKLLLQVKENFEKGENIWTVPTAEINANGLLLYQIRTKDHLYNGKMLKIK